MGLYEELNEKYNKLDDLEIRSAQDVRSLLFSDLSNVRVVRNMLKEIVPFNEIISNTEIRDMIEVISRWEKQLSERLETKGNADTGYLENSGSDPFDLSN